MASSHSIVRPHFLSGPVLQLDFLFVYSIAGTEAVSTAPNITTLNY